LKFPFVPLGAIPVFESSSNSSGISACKVFAIKVLLWSAAFDLISGSSFPKLPGFCTNLLISLWREFEGESYCLLRKRRLSMK